MATLRYLLNSHHFSGQCCYYWDESLKALKEVLVRHDRIGCYQNLWESPCVRIHFSFPHIFIDSCEGIVFIYLSIHASIHPFMYSTTPPLKFTGLGSKHKCWWPAYLLFTVPGVSNTIMAIQNVQVATKAPVSNLCPTPDRAVSWSSFSTGSCTPVAWFAIRMELGRRLFQTLEAGLGLFGQGIRGLRELSGEKAHGLQVDYSPWLHRLLAHWVKHVEGKSEAQSRAPGCPGLWLVLSFTGVYLVQALWQLLF